MQFSLSSPQRQLLSSAVEHMPAPEFADIHDALRGEKNFLGNHAQALATLAQPLIPALGEVKTAALVRQEIVLAAMGSSVEGIPPLQKSVGEELRLLIGERAAAENLPVTTDPSRQYIALIVHESNYEVLTGQDTAAPAPPPTVSFKERVRPHILSMSGVFDDFKTRDIERLFKRAEQDSPVADTAFMAGKQFASLAGENYSALHKERFMAALHGIPVSLINGITETESGAAASVRGIANLYGNVHETTIKRSAEDHRVRHSNLTVLAQAVAPDYTPPTPPPPARRAKRGLEP